MIAHCPTHGEVIPIGRKCPWGCDHEFPPVVLQPVPVVSAEIAAPSLVAANVRDLCGEVGA